MLAGHHVVDRDRVAGRREDVPVNQLRQRRPSRSSRYSADDDVAGEQDLSRSDSQYGAFPQRRDVVLVHPRRQRTISTRWRRRVPKSPLE